MFTLKEPSLQADALLQSGHQAASEDVRLN